MAVAYSTNYLLRRRLVSITQTVSGIAVQREKLLMSTKEVLWCDLGTLDNATV